MRLISKREGQHVTCKVSHFDSLLNIEVFYKCELHNFNIIS